MNIHSYHASARLLCQDEKTETQINKMGKGNYESAKHADALSHAICRTCAGQTGGAYVNDWRTFVLTCSWA